MFGISILRLIGIFFGIIAIAICFYRLRTYAHKRMDVWLLFFFGMALLLVGLFPGIVNFPASVLAVGQHPAGRLITLLVLSSILLWFLVLYQRAKNENRYYQFDNLVRALTVADFLKNNNIDHVPDSIVVLIPAYNEAENLKTVLPQLPASVSSKMVNVLVLDDGSNDGTANAARRNKAMVALHPTNRGGGRRLKQAMNW